MNIGNIGVGVIGGVTSKVFEKEHKIFPYDKFKKEYNSSENLTSLAKNSEVIFISVPTPMKPSGDIDFSIIHDAIQTLEKEVEALNRNKSEILVVIRSTTVSGTTKSLSDKYGFKFAFNPEFLTERTALKDMEETDRIIIGVDDKESEEKMLAVYKPLFPEAKYIILKTKEAEMVKYASNVFLASQVAIANEISQICKHLDIDYSVVRNALRVDKDNPSKGVFKLIGKNIDVPGPDNDLGFGGKCLPKDLNALIYLARENGYRPNLLEEVWSLNLRLRNNKNWTDIPGATSENQNFY